MTGSCECSSVQPRAFLIPTLDGYGRSSSGPGRFHSETGTHGAHSIGERVGHTAGLEAK